VQGSAPAICLGPRGRLLILGVASAGTRTWQWSRARLAGLFGAVYLRPVLATPWTKYFWNSAKTSSIGRIDKKDMANSGPKSLPN
jgi:hypothetical protein